MEKQAHLSLAFLMVWFLISLFGCRQANTSNNVVVTEVVMGEEETVVVTRLVQQIVEVPVTVMPVGSSDPDPVTLEISFQEQLPLLDPQQATSDEAINLIENLFVGLTRYNHLTDSIDPQLATSWEISPDGRVWIFRLRDDIFWMRVQNEQIETVRPVVAEDVAFAIRRLCDPRSRSPLAFVLFVIEGCEAVHRTPELNDADLQVIGVHARDEVTLEVNLVMPASQFLAITSLSLLRPVPAEFIAEFSDEWSLPENLVTNGPFVLTTGSPNGTRTILQRNPLWPSPYSGNVEKVTILHLNERTAFDLWRQKQLDLSPLPSSEEAAMVNDLVRRFDVVPEQEMFYLAYNFDSDVFRYPEVRRAFGAAIDRDRLVEEVYGGRAMPARHFLPVGVIGTIPFDEVGAGYDPDYARQQMAESPFTVCRLMPSIRYLVNASDLALQQAELVRDMWIEELGCIKEQIVIEQVQFGVLLSNTRQDAAAALRPDIWDLGWASYYPDAHNWVGDVLHCTLSENRQKRPCSEADQLILAASQQTPIDARSEVYRQIERLFFAPGGVEPITPLFMRAKFVPRQLWLSYVPAVFGGEQYDSYQIQWDLKQLERSN